MTAAQQLPIISVEDYLDAELDAEVRHEYVGGYVYAMAGAKNAHSRISMSLAGCLHAQLRGQSCQPRNSDTKVRIKLPTSTRFYYPDGMVVSEPNRPDETFEDKPVIIAEVVSESTRRIDSGEKKDAYLTIPSLKAYLLIEQDHIAVTVYRRINDAADEAGFAIEAYNSRDSTIELTEINASLPLAELYEHAGMR